MQDKRNLEWMFANVAAVVRLDNIYCSTDRQICDHIVVQLLRFVSSMNAVRDDQRIAWVQQQTRGIFTRHCLTSLHLICCCYEMLVDRFTSLGGLLLRTLRHFWVLQCRLRFHPSLLSALAVNSRHNLQDSGWPLCPQTTDTTRESCFQLRNADFAGSQRS